MRQLAVALHKSQNFFDLLPISSQRTAGAALQAFSAANALHMVGIFIRVKPHLALALTQAAVIAGRLLPVSKGGYPIKKAQKHAKGTEIFAKRPINKE